MTLPFFETVGRSIGVQVVRWTEQLETSLGIELRTVAKEVASVAFKAAKIALAALLFLVNSSLFVLGAIVAVVVPDKMDYVLARIQRVWDGPTADELKANPNAKPGLNLLGKGIVCVVGVFAWPISLAAGAFFVGASVSLQLQNYSQDAPVPV